MTRSCQSRPHRGFTLVELLVVIAIIAILVGLLLPAIGSVRESGRLMQCRGNLRQIAQACLNYANTNGTLPTPGPPGVPGTAQNGGRLGDPNATGMNAGGWLHLILPFVEQQSLYDLGFGLTGSGATNSLHAALRIKIATAVPLYSCANRGSPLFSPPSDLANILFINGGNTGTAQWRFNPNPELAARSDYAGCVERINTLGSGAGALETLAGRGRLLRSIRDGLSNVFLCGERYLSPDNYNPSATTNFECNNRGWTVHSEGDVYAAGLDQAGVAMPLLQDTKGVAGCVTCLAYTGNNCWPFASRFGSSHNGVPMAMVDGSVHLVAFDISPAVFAAIVHISNDSGNADQLQ